MMAREKNYRCNIDADYSLSAPGKRVICQDDSNSIIVLSGDRNNLFIRFGGDPGKGDTYKVDHTKTDGDTFKTFETRGGDLSLDDQGDTLTIGPDVYTLNCK